MKVRKPAKKEKKSFSEENARVFSKENMNMLLDTISKFNRYIELEKKPYETMKQGTTLEAYLIKGMKDVFQYYDVERMLKVYEHYANYYGQHSTDILFSKRRSLITNLFKQYIELLKAQEEFTRAIKVNEENIISRIVKKTSENAKNMILSSYKT